ncbi:MAG: V-type ATPase subunit [Candidatus Thiodiazotropha sp.]|jgi:V/A-type H+/Na+-transporting ATPase subunit C
MSSQRDQAYLKTRVSLLSTRLLSPVDIEHLKQLSLHQFGERFDLLPIFKQEIDSQQKSILVEQLFLQRLMDELKVLLRPLSGRSRGLMLYWPRKYELYNLKTLIRGKLHNLATQEIRNNLYALPENIRLPHEALLQAENVQEMLRLLERSPYSQIARQARVVFEEHQESFSLGSAIDRLYYTGMLAQANISESIDTHGLKKIIASIIDRQNILWLMRYRLVYRFSPSEAYYLLIPQGGEIHRDNLLELVNLDNLEIIIDRLPEPFRNLLSDIKNITQARQLLDRWVADRLRKLIHYSPDAVVSALCYLIVRDIDLRHLYAIIQGKLLEMPQNLLDEAILSDQFATTVGEAAI